MNVIWDLTYIYEVSRISPFLLLRHRRSIFDLYPLDLQTQCIYQHFRLCKYSCLRVYSRTHRICSSQDYGSVPYSLLLILLILLHWLYFMQVILSFICWSPLPLSHRCGSDHLRLLPLHLQCPSFLLQSPIWNRPCRIAWLFQNHGNSVQ